MDVCFTLDFKRDCWETSGSASDLGLKTSWIKQSNRWVWVCHLLTPKVTWCVQVIHQHGSFITTPFIYICLMFKTCTTRWLIPAWLVEGYVKLIRRLLFCRQVFRWFMLSLLADGHSYCIQCCNLAHLPFILFYKLVKQSWFKETVSM